MKEIWKDITGYEGLYQISNEGRVKSLSREIGHCYAGQTRTIPEKIMKICDNGNGYKLVYLTKNKIRKSKYIHRLVAESFLGKTENDNVVNYKDYNPANNRVENLEWCSQKENINFSSERMKHENHNHKLSKTGYKYVYLRGDKFRVLIKQLGIEKTFDSVDKAIIFRDKEIKRNEKYFAKK